MNAHLQQQLQTARIGARKLANLPIEKRNAILVDLAEALVRDQKQIEQANQQDVAAVSQGYTLLDRLQLTPRRFSQMVEGVKSVVQLTDPLNRLLEERTVSSGLVVSRISVPLGVIGIIYESRPDITVEICSLAIKSGNAVVLKGGTDAYYSNQAIINTIHTVLHQHGLPESGIIFIDPRDRENVTQMMRANGLIDVLIPRGGQNLIHYVRDTATVPVIETGAGVCHTYIEKSARLEWAVPIVLNAKLRRPSVCNTLDTLIIDQEVASELLQQLAPSLAGVKVKIHADLASYSLLQDKYPAELLFKLEEKDLGKEFLALEMSIVLVEGMSQAIEHIQKYGSGHSEAIVSENKKEANRFVAEIDAAAVFVNAPTSFTDGFEFGLGAEIGISTQKLHARGPMGLEALTSYKWVVIGEGQIRSV